MLTESWNIVLTLLSLISPIYVQVIINTGRISTEEFRLFGGSAPNEGRLQIRHAPDGSWYTVCADVSALDDAIGFAVCARMGFKVACDYGPAAELGTTGPTVDLRPIEDVTFGDCELASAPGQLDCEVNGIPSGDNACSLNRQDLWISCAAGPGDLELRLAEQLSSFTGILQARCRGSRDWMSVCYGRIWDSRDATVACRHLGFSFVAESRSVSLSTLDPASIPARVAISEYGCVGNESDILECQLGLTLSSCPTVPRLSCGIETNEYGSTVGLCGNRNLCGAECAQQLDTTQRPRKVCHCDDACMVFGDCCYDYQVACNPESRDPPTSLNGLPIGWFGCVAVPGFDTTFDGYFLVNVCPDSWSGSGVREMCELPADNSDVFTAIPVYNNVTLAQYKNIYCAICHGEDYEGVTSWAVEARYSNDRGGQPFLPNLGLGPPTFGTYTGTFVVSPPNVGEDIRQCSAPIIDTCLEEYRGSEVERGCKGFAAAVIYRPSAFSGTITNYRNAYCGRCNNISVTLTDTCGYNYCEELCSDPWERCFTRCARGEDFLTIDVLFNFQSQGSSFSGTVTCMTGELYDPFLGSCRLLACSPGYEVQGDECVKIIAPPTVKPDQNKPAGSSFAYSPNNTVNVDLVECLRMLLGENTKNIVYWDATRDNSLNTLAVNFLAENETALDEVSGALGRLEDGSWCNATSLAFFLEFVSVFPVDYCVEHSVAGFELFHDYFSQDESTQVTRLSQFDYNPGRKLYYNFTQIDRACLEINLTCVSVVTLNSTEFAQFEKGTETAIVYIPSGLVLPPGTYVILANGRAVVCADVIIVTPTDGPPTVTALAYRYLYLVLTILSVLALAATFIVYFLLPELLNLAGKCILNLVVALFVANLLLLLNGFFVEVPILCLVVAPVIHLTWLAAFMWMAALSFNVARTITSKVVNKFNKPTTKPLLLYMLFAWGTSLVIVCVCIALHFCQCAETGPIYANKLSCYIVNSKVNLYAFGVPVALTLTVSMCLFVFTVVHLRISRASTRIARNETRLQEARAEFVIYVRLCILMGLGWIFGFLTQVVEGYAVLFIFVILNSIQGILIFVSFCSTARARGLLAERFRQGFCRTRRQRVRAKRGDQLDSAGTHIQTQTNTGQSDTTRI